MSNMNVSTTNASRAQISPSVTPSTNRGQSQPTSHNAPIAAQTSTTEIESQALKSPPQHQGFEPDDFKMGQVKSSGDAEPAQTTDENFVTLLNRIGGSADLGYIPLEQPQLKTGLSQVLIQMRDQLSPEILQKLSESVAGKDFLQALEDAAAGKLDPDAIIKIQTFIAASGIDIGYPENSLGIDGDYGPLTHQGLQQALAQLTQNPEQALAGLKERETQIVQQVKESNPAIANIVPTGEVSEANGSIVSTPYKDSRGNGIQLSPAAAKGLGSIYDIAKSKGVTVSVNSHYRSVERQTQLWNEALKKYGSPEAARKWVAPPGRSRHNSGNAIDMTMTRNGKKISQQEFDAIIRQAGMYRPMSWEGWHVEPIGTRR